MATLFYQWYINKVYNIFNNHEIINKDERKLFIKLCKMIGYLKHFLPNDYHIFQLNSNDLTEIENWSNMIRTYGICAQTNLVSFIKQTIPCIRNTKHGNIDGNYKKLETLNFSLFPKRDSLIIDYCTEMNDMTRTYANNILFKKK